jgi:hypothetical protein
MGKGKGNFDLIHTMKAERESRILAALILNVSTQWS